MHVARQYVAAIAAFRMLRACLGIRALFRRVIVTMAQSYKRIAMEAVNNGECGQLCRFECLADLFALFVVQNLAPRI